MSTRQFAIGMCLCTMVTVAWSIPEPEGQEPPPEDARFDAVCAVGKSHRMTGDTALDWFDENGNFDPLRSGGNTGSGVLIAPNLVLTANHLWAQYWNGCQPTLDDYLCAPWEECNDSNNRRWVVRFRRNPDGTVGTMSEFPYPPNDVRGPDSFFHVDVIGAIELGDCQDSVILVLAEDVTHIEPLPMVAPDPRLFHNLGFNELGFLGEVDAPDVLHSRGVITGWGSSTPERNAQGSGQFRVREGYGDLVFTIKPAAVETCFLGQPVALHDSGTPFLIESEDGSMLVSFTVSGFNCLIDDCTVSGRNPSVWFGTPQLGDLVDPASWFDLTGSADPDDSMYGKWNGLVDLADVLYVAAETTQGNLDVDFTGSSDPDHPLYGVPDGVADETDYEYYVNLLEARPVSDVGPWPPLPLATGDADNTGDRRLTEDDYDAGLSYTQLIKYDFDRDGTLGGQDLALAADINGRFGHGLRADLDGDGDQDLDDLDAIRDLLAKGNPWDYQMFGDPGYNIVLDSNLDGYTTVLDRRDIAAMFLNGEVTNASHMFDLSDSIFDNPPDFYMTRWDRLAAFWQLMARSNTTYNMLETSGSADPDDPAWGVPDELSSIADFKYFLYRQYEQFGPDGIFPSEEVTARVWPAFDANGDGRFTYADYEYLQALDPDSDEAMKWDLDGDGVFEPYIEGETGSDAVHVFNAWAVHGWDQNVAGDFDKDMNPTGCCACDVSICFPELCNISDDSAPDCDDYWAIYNKIHCKHNSLFDGRSFFSDQDEGYMPVLDADLDGDNDLDDQYWIVLQSLGITDINLDSMLDQLDIDLYLELHAAGDPAADLAEPIGVLNTFDTIEYLNRFSENICQSRTNGLPRPCFRLPQHVPCPQAQGVLE